MQELKQKPNEINKPKTNKTKRRNTMEKFKNALKKIAKVILTVNIIIDTVAIIDISGVSLLAKALAVSIQALLLTGLQFLK